MCSSDLLTLTIKRIVYIDGFRGNSSYIYICEDAAHNVVIYKGDAKCFPNIDETGTVIATVKEHGVREGVKQTIINRPKKA